MRGFTNKSGEFVEVSKEHLDIAVKIKIELQKSSPSRRVSWMTHKRLMEKEGFFDSDTNENYRCMIKDYQKSIGELPQVEKYANMVADGKIQSIKELVGEIAYEKRSAQNVFRELNKVKRDVIDFTIIAEQIGYAFRNYDLSDIKLKYNPIHKTSKEMIVCISDLHVGALVNTDVNIYNFEVTKRRMEEYLNKVINEIERNEISKVYLSGVGDFIENPYMHNLAYSCEFTLAEQIVMASDIVIKFMVGLSKYVEVTVFNISGNHDRLNGDKNKSLDGDHAVKGINKAVQSFIENSKIERVTYEQAKDYEHSIVVNGVNVKFLHGDLDNINDANLLAKHSSLDGVDYSLIIMGHYHHHRIVEVGLGKYLVLFGSVKGADDFGMKNRRYSSVSQGIVMIDEDGEMEVKKISLK